MILACPLCILVLYGGLIPLSLLHEISPPGGLIEDFNKHNCLPVNKLNINGVTKKNLRFWTKISVLERVSIPSAWSYIWHICCSLFFISGNFHFFNFISIHYHTQKQTKNISWGKKIQASSLLTWHWLSVQGKEYFGQACSKSLH